MTEAPPTRIAVFSKEELGKYGYKAVTHPDGYVYFERNNEGAPSIPVKSEYTLVKSVKTEPEESTENEGFVTCGQNNSDLFSSESPSQSVNPQHHKNITSTHDFNASPECLIDSCTVSNSASPQNSLHQFSLGNENLKLQHAEEIKIKGFTSCPLQTCNFISLSVAAMARHSAKCNGVPAFHTNLCTRCNCWLISSMQRDTHAAQCHGIKFCINSTPSHFLGKNPSSLARQRPKPQPKRKAAPSKEMEIVQPGLKRPVGTYLRKRSYTTLHFDIWTKKFQEDKYIPCHFKGCHFIGLSVADMCNHWAYCSGNSSFAKFKCQYCSGVVTSQALLDMHIANSHSEGEVIGREEEYPSQDDKIAESLELLCDTSVSHENLRSRERKMKLSLNSTESSIDHNYSSFLINDNIKRANEFELIEIFESTFSLKPPTNKLEFASVSTTSNLLLESPKSVDKKSVIVEVSEVVKNCDLNIKISDVDKNIPSHDVNNDDVLPSNLTSLEKNTTLPIANKSFIRKTVITDGRLINCINDKTKDPIVDRIQNEDELTDQPINTTNENVDILQNNINDTLDVSVDNNIGIDIENNPQDNSLISGPIKRKRGRPKKIKPDGVDDPSSPSSPRKKRIRRNTSDAEEVDDVALSSRKRRTVTCLKFSDDSGSESCESEDESFKGSESEDEEYYVKEKTSIKRKVGRPLTAEKLNKSITIETIRQSQQNITATSDSIDNTGIDIENNPQDNSSVSEPVKKKRGRPKKIKTDVSLNLNDDPSSSSRLRIRKARSKTSDEEEVDDMALSSRERRTVARLKFSDDSGSESCESEGKSFKGSESEDEEYSANKKTSVKRKVPKAGKLNESIMGERRRNSEMNEAEPENECRIKQTPIKKRGRPRKSNNNVVDDESREQKNVKSQSEDESPTEVPVVKKRGRPPAYQAPPCKGDVKCGKCSIVVKGRHWEKHNSINHIGLGWLEGEPPIDQRSLDSQTLLLRLRSAFKICKVGTCELCGIQKKSFLGLHSHITICGKTSEQLKVALLTCNVCGKQLQSYCMPNHMKKHEKDAAVALEEENAPLPKRRSAIKAVTNFKEVLEDEKKIWSIYKKGDPLLDINFQFKSTGKSKVPCMRENCNEVLTKHKYALEHFFDCSTVPEEYYQCLECPYYGVTEEDINQHCDNRHKDEEKNDVVDVLPDYDASTESEEEEAGVHSIKSKTHCEDVRVSKAEFAHKTQFVSRENIYAREGRALYIKAVQEEMERQSQKISLDMYDKLHTSKSDWIRLEVDELKQYLPPLHSSLPVRHRFGTQVSKYEKLKIFDSLSSEDLNVGFVGGVVRSLSWCPTDLKRVKEAHQYLAVSVDNHLENPTYIRSNSTTSSLLQIWDCGTINGDSNKLTSLRMVLGIALDVGELWDLTWSPVDTWQDGNDDRLPRIGLIAVACQDGAVRLYSISSPTTETSKDWPIYKVHPVAVLKRDDCNIKKDDACLRLTWGAEGILCAGYRSGLVSVWRLQELNCNHVCKQDKTFILYNSSSFNPHFHPITDIALCPSNNQILATGGSDKRMKLWNLMNVLVPFRVESSSSLQAFSWMNNWPGLNYLVEENVVGIDMPPQFNFCKTSLLKTNSSINDISFSNWAFLTGVVNTAGEFYIRPNIDPFLDSKKKPRIETVVSKVIITCTSAEQKRVDHNSYSDIEKNNLGITFTDYNFYDSLKNAEKTAEEPCYANYTANSVKKVAFNPNYRAFHHAALGVQCGFIRIMRLKFLHNSLDRIISLEDK